MKKKLQLTFILAISLALLNSKTYAQACEANINAIKAPINAPTNTDGNLAACVNGSNDALFIQDTLPQASLPNVNYVIEFSNGNPLLINNTGAWSTVEQNLQAGDSVKIVALTYDIDAVDEILSFASVLCTQPSDTLFGIPCAPVLDLLNGVTDGEPGLQSLNEALILAASILDVQIFSIDTAVNVLNDVNDQLSALQLAVCFEYTEPYTIIITDCESNCTAAAGEAADLQTTEVCLGTEVADLIVTDFVSPPSDTENNLFIVMENNPGISLWNKNVIGFSTDGSFDFADKAAGSYCFVNMVHSADLDINTLESCADGTTINNIINSCLTNSDCYSFGGISTEYCVEVCNFADIDNDGLNNNLEDINGNGDLTDDDTDGDGIANFEDADDDGDNIPSAQEDANGNGDLTDDDEDEDGIPNYLDDEFTVGIFDDYKSLSIYPNPNNGQFLINLPSNETIQNISIYNYLGQSVSYKQENNTITLTQQQSGVYILQITTNIGGFITKIQLQ